jgi:hypothetical protein
MRFYGLIVGLLAVWRITHLLAAEDGPGEILARLRRCAGDGFWGRLLDCFYCLSLWAAVPVAWLLVLLGRGTSGGAGAVRAGGGEGVAARGAHGGGAGGGGWELAVLLWLALSAGAILIERLTGRLAGAAGDLDVAGAGGGVGAAGAPGALGEAADADGVADPDAPMPIYHEDP